MMMDGEMEDPAECYGPPQPAYLADELHDVPSPDGGRIAANPGFMIRKHANPQRFPSGSAGVGVDD